MKLKTYFAVISRVAVPVVNGLVTVTGTIALPILKPSVLRKISASVVATVAIDDPPTAFAVLHDRKRSTISIVNSNVSSKGILGTGGAATFPLNQYESSLDNQNTADILMQTNNFVVNVPIYQIYSEAFPNLPVPTEVANLDFRFGFSVEQL